MLPQPDSIRFPMACPACSAVSAMPTMTLARVDGVTAVGMRCKHCKHEWRFEMPANSDVAKMRSGVRLPLAKPPKDER